MQYVTVDVLEHYGVNFRNAENNNLTVKCPFHDDTNPSGKINLNTGQYVCWVCNRHLTVLNYIAKAFNKSILEVYYEVGKLDTTPTKYKIQDPTDIQAWHVKLFQMLELLEALHKRCIDDDLIRQYKLGAFTPGDDVPEIRIPIFNKRGETIAVKAYRPGHKECKYYWPKINCNKGNKEERLTTLLYPAEQLIYHKLLLCGGELKALAASKVLNERDIGAISTTGSESVKLTPQQCKALEGKIIYVCYDVDETGKKNAIAVCRTLRKFASSLHLVTLPLDIISYPHGDINDYIAVGGDLYSLILSTPVWQYEPVDFDKEAGINANDEVIETTLDKSVTASMAKKKVRIRTVISSIDNSPYTIPKTVQLHCDRNHTYCATCKIFQEFTTEDVDLTLSSERVEIMELVGQDLSKQERVLKRAFFIPARCTAVSFETKTFYHIEDVRISQQLDISSRTNERSMQAAYCIGENRLELNESYVMTGRMFPHPTTQQATLLITEFEATQDALSSYKPENLDKFKIFQPTEWTVKGLEDKLNHIYTDLANNITRIYGRKDLHLFYDLAFHSVLWLPDNLKGWVDILVVGDSAQGKTVCIDRLIAHYKLGERVVCKGATVAGLMGGVQQHGKRWFATWGKIPTHDRRLIVLDEVKGTRTDVIAGLTDMRSKGTAELTKIERRRTNARTRLIWISNPRKERTIREYNLGIDAVRELIGNPEDIRRFDAVMIVAQKEVDEDTIYMRERPKVPHVYTSNLCRELILFGWTVDKVVFEDEHHISKIACRLTAEFAEEIPIVDNMTMREKLYRLAASLAVRTFSIQEDGSVYVRNCHAEYIEKFLCKLYSSSIFGYLEYSKKKLASSKILEPNAVSHRLLRKVPFPLELIQALLETDEFDYNMIQDVLGWPMQDARDLLAFFNRHRCIKKSERLYRKTANFNALLLELEKRCEKEGRPNYVVEEF